MATSRSNAFVLFTVAALLIYTTWIAAGMRSPLQDLLPWFAGILLLIHVLCPLATTSLPHRITGLLRDPFIWCMVPLLILVLLQWTNAGRTLVYEPFEDAWILTDPPRPGWPSAIKAYEAQEMWNWFFPLTLIVGILRARVQTLTDSRLVTHLLLGNAILLAGSGIVVLARQSIQQSGRPPEAFATFGYQNHAGVFFSLMLCLAFGRLIASSKQEPPSRTQQVFLITAGLTCMAGAFLSLSRAGMLLASAAALLFLIDLAVQSRHLITPVRLLNTIVLVAALGATVFFVAGGTNATWIKHEASTLQSGLGEQLLSDSRITQLKVAGRIIADHPWFGTGAWGFKHLPGIYSTPAEWQHVAEAGAANVHCDFIQYLSELGLLGMIMLLAAGSVISIRLLNRKACAASPELRWTLLGIACVIASSLIDLPFRNTAILQHSCVALVLAGPYFRKTTEELTQRSGEST